MSPSLDFEDATASGPEPDVWGTLGTGLIVAATTFIAAGISYSFAIDGSTRERFVIAAQVGGSPITAGLLLAGVLALLEAARRQQPPAMGGATIIAVALAVVIVCGALYSVWHYATVDLGPSLPDVEMPDPQWRRAGFILYELAAAVLGAGALAILLRTDDDTSVEVA
jgi:hypothetical protein